MRTVMSMPTPDQTCQKCGSVRECILIKEDGWVCGACQIGAQEAAVAKPETGIAPADLIPTDPTPFGAMAQLFGAATTVLQDLNRNWAKDYVSADELWKATLAWFGTRGDEFCHKAMGIILQYYAGHQDRESWEAARKAYEDLLGSGFDGLNLGTLKASVRRHAKGSTATEAERLLIEMHYSHLKG